MSIQQVTWMYVDAMRLMVKVWNLVVDVIPDSKDGILRLRLRLRLGLFQVDILRM